MVRQHPKSNTQLQTGVLWYQPTLGIQQSIQETLELWNFVEKVLKRKNPRDFSGAHQ